MAVMRSIMYVPGNNPKMVEKAPSIPADIITLDLEDSVPPSEKEAARKLVAEKLKYAGSGGAQAYVRINNWETEMTNDALEAVVWEGLDGVTCAEVSHEAGTAVVELSADVADDVLKKTVEDKDYKVTAIN